MESDAEKELSRIERELEAKEQQPGKPLAKQGGWVGSNEGKSKNQSLDAVVVGGTVAPRDWSDLPRRREPQ